MQVNSGFFYSSAEQREKLVAAERAVTDERVQRIIDLKHQARAQLVLGQLACTVRDAARGLWLSRVCMRV